MRSALASTFAHPAWWAMALAAFLVRGGIVVVLLPIVMLPSAASVTTALAPPLEALILGRPSVEGVVLGSLVVGAVLAVLAGAGLLGSWLDLALAREAAADEELELGWQPDQGSVSRALTARSLAHVPTLIALAYAAYRLGTATYDELLAPGDASLPLAARVVLRAPEGLVVLVGTWLLAEAAGGLAARRVAAGEPVGSAIRRAYRALVHRRALATLGLTTLVLAIFIVPFVFAVGRSWERVRAYLIDGVSAPELVAALVLLIGSWVLGLAFLGAVLAWRATAWSMLLVPSRAGATGVAAAAESEPATVTAGEPAPG
jgi:hypothetical protein